MKWDAKNLPHKEEIRLTEIPAGIQFDNKTLTKHSSFTELLKYINSRYRRPFVGKEDAPRSLSGIERKFHDGFHIAKALLIQELLMHWILSHEYQQLFLDLQPLLIKIQSDDEQFKLSQLALAYHDMMNCSEKDNKDEKAQYLNFIQEMFALGFSLETIAPFAIEILTKNTPRSPENITLSAILTGDPDTVEYMRVINDNAKFLPEKLHIFNYVKHRLSSLANEKTTKQYQKFMNELDLFLSDYRVLSSFLRWITVSEKGYELHRASVMSSDLYKETRNAIFEANTLIFEFKNYAAKTLCPVEDKSTPKLSIRQLLIPSKTPHFLSLRKNFNPPKISIHDPVIKLFYQRKLLFRLFRLNRLSTEKLFEEKISFPDTSGGLNIDDLDVPSLLDFKQDSSLMPEDMKSKKIVSTMLIPPETGIQIAVSGYIGILIFSDKLNLEGVYKINIFRYIQKQGLLFSDRVMGGAKNLKTLPALLEKISEISARSEGKIPDSRHRYYGRKITSNEVVVSDVPKKNLVGLFYLKSRLPQSAIALLGICCDVQKRLNRDEMLPFYEYDHIKGSLVFRSLLEIIALARWTDPGLPPPESKSLVEINPSWDDIYCEMSESPAFHPRIYSSVEDKDQRMDTHFYLYFDYTSEKLNFTGQCRSIFQEKEMVIQLLTDNNGTLLATIPDVNRLNIKLMQYFVERQLEEFYLLIGQHSWQAYMQRNYHLQVIHSEYCKIRSPLHIRTYYTYFYFAIWFSFDSKESADLAKKEVLPHFVSAEDKSYFNDPRHIQLFPPLTSPAHVPVWITRIEIRHLQTLHCLNQGIKYFIAQSKIKPETLMPTSTLESTTFKFDLNSQLLIYYGSVNAFHPKSQVDDVFFHRNQLPRLSDQKALWQCLLVATQQGNLNQVKSLVSFLHAFKFIELCPDGDHPLIIAARKGFARILKILLFYDQQANEENQLLLRQNNQGLTAYEEALKAGQSVCTSIIGQVVDAHGIKAVSRVLSSSSVSLLPVQNNKQNQNRDSSSTSEVFTLSSVPAFT